MKDIYLFYFWEMGGDFFYEKATTSKVEQDLLRFCYELTNPPEKRKIKKQCRLLFGNYN